MTAYEKYTIKNEKSRKQAEIELYQKLKRNDEMAININIRAVI